MNDSAEHGAEPEGYVGRRYASAPPPARDPRGAAPDGPRRSGLQQPASPAYRPGQPPTWRADQDAVHRTNPYQAPHTFAGQGRGQRSDNVWRPQPRAGSKKRSGSGWVIILSIVAIGTFASAISRSGSEQASTTWEPQANDRQEWLDPQPSGPLVAGETVELATYGGSIEGWVTLAEIERDFACDGGETVSTPEDEELIGLWLEVETTPSGVVRIGDFNSVAYDANGDEVVFASVPGCTAEEISSVIGPGVYLGGWFVIWADPQITTLEVQFLAGQASIEIDLTESGPG